MGIGSILGSALKSLPWNRIAVAAMEQAPELFQKAKERFMKSGEPAVETAAETELQDRIAKLEALLLEREGLIREQSAKRVVLEERCAGLEARLLRFKIISGILFATALVLLALLMK